MNKQELDLLNIIKKEAYVNQRQLSEASGYSLGKVNTSLAELVKAGYLNADYRLTEQAKELFTENRPNQAVILAAGAGMRMIPINTEVSKGMLEVRGETLVERLIKQLKEKGIHKITIVVGFMKEQYEYLIDEYGVELVYNKEYAVKNNLFSLAKVKDRLENAYIVPCDLWCRTNPFSETELYSWYMIDEMPDEDSTIRMNRKMELKAVGDSEAGNHMVGIAYINKESARTLEQKISEMKEHRRYYNSFWEDAAMEKGKMILFPKEVKKGDVLEINTLEQLRDLDENSDQLNSELLDIIAETLSCEQKEITEIEPLKKGMTNRSFRFRCGEKRYIMRVPGEGTDKMINRSQEYDVYQVIGPKGICDPVRYMSKEKGYKITEFLEGARNCDAENENDVKACMKYLRNVHEQNLKVDHSFDLFEQIEKYEQYRNGEKSIYRDYEKTKEKMYELKFFVDQQEKEYTLTHIDAVPDNFLFVDDRIYLIDWEYSGMQDPHVDIAMFAIYALYEKEQIDRLIDAYFTEGCLEEVRTKIYCYIAICSFLWSNWCEYKRILGVEFGEYSLKQYRYAKEFYRLAKERMEND